VASSSHSTLCDAGVHRQWMLPLGVEKQQGLLALVGGEQGTCGVLSIGKCVKAPRKRGQRGKSCAL